MNDQRIAVITDSGTDTPADFIRQHDVRVVPLLVSYSDGHTYKSGVDITAQDVLDRLDTEIPKTSLPAPTQVLSTYQKAREDGYTCAVVVTISAALSGTNQMARFVANEVKDFPVIVIDTKSIGLIAGFVVMEAVRMVESGVPFDQLEERLNDLSSKSKVFFAVKDMKYLRAGGRISETVYRLGSMLNIKPVMWCDEHGYYAVVKKARGWKRALTAEVDAVRKEAAKYPKVRVGVCTSMGAQQMAEATQMLRDAIPNIGELVQSGLSADLIVHTGPDLMGMGVQPME
ncbi:MAG: DegV family protein [Atopobiaceae bacterium]